MIFSVIDCATIIRIGNPVRVDSCCIPTPNCIRGFHCQALRAIYIFDRLSKEVKSQQGPEGQTTVAPDFESGVSHFPTIQP